MAAGALNLASPEVKINLGSAESSDPIDVEQKELRETNSLVEEFMLLANVSVAKKIDEVFPQTAVLRCVVFILISMRYQCSYSTRRHLPPPKTNFEKLQDVLMKRKGFKLDVSSSGALAASLDKCVVRHWPVDSFARSLTINLGPFCTGIQYLGSYHGDEVHAFCRVFLLRECFQRYVWTLRTRKSDLHAFHESDQAICW